MTPVGHESDAFRIASTAPLLPRARFEVSHVTLELPVDIAVQLRSLCGSLGSKDGELVVTQTFPSGRTVQDYMYGPHFSAAEIHGIGVLIHNALSRAGV
jgi:hypothetical protein